MLSIAHLNAGAVRELEGDIGVGLLVIELAHQSRQQTLALENNIDNRDGTRE